MNVLYLTILVSYCFILSKKFNKVPDRSGGVIEHRARTPPPPVFRDFFKFCGIVRNTVGGVVETQTVLKSDMVKVCMLLKGT